MGRPEKKRCVHCQDVYLWWWGTTPYTNDPDNNGTYCPECHKAIRLALEAIPKKRRVQYVETNKFTCLDLDPNTPEPTDLPPKEDLEFVVKPMTMMSRRSDLFEYAVPTNNAVIGDLATANTSQLQHTRGYGNKTLVVQPLPEETGPSSGGPEGVGPAYDLTPEQLASGDFPDPMYPSREEQEEAMKLLELPVDDEPLKMTCHKPIHGSMGMVSNKSNGTHPAYAPTYMRREYSAVSRSEFSKETLPEGSLPIYDKDPDIKPLCPGFPISYSVQKVESGLIDMLDPWNKNKVGHVVRDGIAYYYEWWTRTGKAAGKVSIKMEVDAVTGEIIDPWKDYR